MACQHSLLTDVSHGSCVKGTPYALTRQVGQFHKSCPAYFGVFNKPFIRQWMQIQQKKSSLQKHHWGAENHKQRIVFTSIGERKSLVARSLSVLLPVKNAQSTLAPTVHRILDVVSELSEQIELLIIDDGSADATSEVAIDLTRHYPQVRAICQGRSLGREAAIRSALQKSNWRNCIDL